MCVSHWKPEKESIETLPVVRALVLSTYYFPSASLYIGIKTLVIMAVIPLLAPFTPSPESFALFLTRLSSIWNVNSKKRDKLYIMLGTTAIQAATTHTVTAAVKVTKMPCVYLCAVVLFCSYTFPLFLGEWTDAMKQITMLWLYTHITHVLIKLL